MPSASTASIACSTRSTFGQPRGSQQDLAARSHEGQLSEKASPGRTARRMSIRETMVPKSPRELLPKGSSDVIGDRLDTTRAFSSAVEHTRYMGEVARSIRAAPTIALLVARQGAGPARR